MNNTDTLSMINSAMKAVTNISALGASVLQPEYINKYVQAMRAERTILKDCRYIDMQAQTYNMDRTEFGGRITVSGVESTAPTASDPDFAQVQLVAKEFVALATLTDQAARRTIERQQFANTLTQMTANKFGEDAEALAVWGDTTKYTSGDLFKQQDGWIKKATNKIYGTESTSGAADQDFDKTGDVTDILSKMLTEYPRNYLKNRSSLRFYLPSDAFDQYIDEVGVRETAQGDNALATNIARPFKGVPVIESYVLNDADGRDTTDGYGKTLMLLDPENTVFGNFHQITMEQEREAIKRQTNFIVTRESDQAFVNPNVNCVALYDIAKPAS